MIYLENYTILYEIFLVRLDYEFKKIRERKNFFDYSQLFGFVYVHQQGSTDSSINCVYT